MANPLKTWVTVVIARDLVVAVGDHGVMVVAAQDQKLLDVMVKTLNLA
ncbi:MAG: hypothetical protein AAFR24_19010 [Cyanobacteria bacterium J06627_3]